MGGYHDAIRDGQEGNRIADAQRDALKNVLAGMSWMRSRTVRLAGYLDHGWNHDHRWSRPAQSWQRLALVLSD